MAKRKARRSASDLLGDAPQPVQDEQPAPRRPREPMQGNSTYQHEETLSSDDAAERFAVLAVRDRQSFVMWFTRKGWRVGCPSEDIGRVTELIDAAEGQ